MKLPNCLSYIYGVVVFKNGVDLTPSRILGIDLKISKVGQVDKTTAVGYPDRGLVQSSKQGEFHPKFLTEPYVNLSIHTALQENVFN